MGQREIKQDKGIAVCPYCDFVEQLVVDHFMIDHDAAKKLLQKQEEERQKAIKEKNLQDYRIAFWVLSVCVSLLALPIILAYFHLLLLYFYFLVWSLIAISLYPNWKPLLWASVFPVPLTKLLTTSDLVKQKFNSFVRVIFTIGGWLAYVLLLGGMLAFDTLYVQN